MIDAWWNRADMLPGMGLINAAARPLARTAATVVDTTVQSSQALTLAALDRVLAAPFTLAVVDRVVASPLVERTAERVLRGPEIERIVEVALESERAEAVVASALDSPAMERLVNRALESRLGDETLTRVIEEATARLAASKGMWELIDEVAASPAITAAITQHGVGFADQVADEVRDRSRHADAWMETVARRFLRRRPAAPEAG